MNTDGLEFKPLELKWDMDIFIYRVILISPLYYCTCIQVHFPCSADHEQDWQPYPVDPYSAICDDHTYIHTYDRAGLRGYVQFNKYIHT